MSNQNYAGQGTLPPDLEQRVRKELSPEERLVWVGQPNPRLFRPKALVTAVIGGFCGTMGVIIALLLVGVNVGFTAIGPALAGNGPHGNSDFAGVVISGVILLASLAIGGYVTAAPIWMPRRVARTAYALTNRRALVFQPHWLGKGHTVRRYPPESIARMFVLEDGSGAGSLVFEEQVSIETRKHVGEVSSPMDGRTRQVTWYGFMGVDRVREVEQLVRRTLGLSKGATQP